MSRRDRQFGNLPASLKARVVQIQRASRKAVRASFRASLMVHSRRLAKERAGNRGHLHRFSAPRNCGRHHRRRDHADPRVFARRLRPRRTPRNNAMRCRRCGRRAVKANRAKAPSLPCRLDKMLMRASLQDLRPCRRSVVTHLHPWKVSTGRWRQLPRSRRRTVSVQLRADAPRSVRYRLYVRIDGYRLLDDAQDMESPASVALSTMNGRPTSITSSGRSATGRQTARPEAISGARWTKLSSVKVPS